MNSQEAPPGYRWSNFVRLLLPEPRGGTLARPVPPWPTTFEVDWQPEPGRPTFALAGTTQTVSRTLHHFSIEEVRDITFEVIGSKERRANDWHGYHIHYRGRALPPSAARRWDQIDRLVAINWGRPPLIVIVLAKVAITHDDAPGMWGESDFTSTEPNFTTVAPINHKVTAKERRLFDRGKDLLSTFVTTMTLRGKPGSGDSEEQRRELARERLIEAGRKLQQRRMKIGRRELMTPLAVDSVDGVAEVLRRADWTLDDLRKELNSTHTT